MRYIPKTQPLLSKVGLARVHAAVLDASIFALLDLVAWVFGQLAPGSVSALPIPYASSVQSIFNMAGAVTIQVAMIVYAIMVAYGKGLGHRLAGLTVVPTERTKGTRQYLPVLDEKPGVVRPLIRLFSLVFVMVMVVTAFHLIVGPSLLLDSMALGTVIVSIALAGLDGSPTFWDRLSGTTFVLEPSLSP